MLSGQGQQYGSNASMKGMPSQYGGQSSMKQGQQQMGNQGYYPSGQPFSAGIQNQYNQQQQGLYTGGPPQAQAYNGMGQGFNGQMGPQSQGSSQMNPAPQMGQTGLAPGSRTADPIARAGSGGNYLFPGSML